jgi:hypothetical protein
MRKKAMIGKIALALTFAVASQTALAIDYSCDGPVNGVTVGPGGHVSAASAGGQQWGYFCQLGTTTNGVSPDTCKGILAVLLSAQASGKSIRIWYRDDNNCSTNRGWNYLSTMYWGPSMLD